MRNLAISSVAIRDIKNIPSSNLDIQYTSFNVSAVTFDMDEQVIYAVLERVPNSQQSISGGNQVIQVLVIKIEAGIVTVNISMIDDPRSVIRF